MLSEAEGRDRQEVGNFLLFFPVSSASSSSGSRRELSVPLMQ